INTNYGTESTSYQSGTILNNSRDLSHSIIYIHSPEDVESILLPSQKHAIMSRKLSFRSANTHQLNFEDLDDNEDEVKDVFSMGSWKRPFRRLKKWWYLFRRTRKMTFSHTPYIDLPPQDQMAVRTFLIDFGYTMGKFAIASHRIEENLMVVSNYYGVMGNYFVTPSAIWFNFKNVQIDPNSSSDSDDVIQSPYPDQYNSSFSDFKLMDLDGLTHQIATGELQSAEHARKRIKNILKEPALFTSPLWTIFVTTTFAAVFGVLLDGTWAEIISAIIGGILTSFILIVQDKVRLMSRISIGICAFVSGMVAIAMRHIFKAAGSDVHVDVSLVALCAVVMLFPGMSITTAIDEMISGHIQSGTVRIVRAFVNVVSIGFGLLVSSSIDIMINGKIKTVSFDRQPISDWLKIACLPCNIVIVIVYFKVPRYFTSYLFISMACTAAYVGDLYWNRLLSKELAGILNASVIGFIGSLYSFVSLRPSTVVTCCAILLLVPGYASANSISMLLQSDVQTFVITMFSAIIAASSLVTGLVVAEIIFPKNKGRLS
ncbi:10 TM domain-containing transmembrane protein, partial [Acrasis kona]